MLSIVIPIYNAKNYLADTLNSILQQGLSDADYEVLLINDGSSDDSELACKKFVSAYPHIFRYFKKSNGGVSSARNLGIEHAKGEYIYFMDADDLLINNGLSSVFYKFDLKKYDIIYFSSITQLSQTADKQHLTTPPTTNILTFEGTGLEYLRLCNMNTFVWNMIIKKNLLTDNKIHFADLRIGEDVLFNFECLLKANKIARVNNCIYRYIVRPNSAVTTRSINHMRKAVENYLFLLKRIYEEAQQRNNDVQLYTACRTFVARQLTPFLSRLLSANFNFSDFQKIKEDFGKLRSFSFHNKTLNVITILFYCPLLYKFASLIWRRIFIPYIHPLLSRN